jgi:hypothetical protein
VQLPEWAIELVFPAQGYARRRRQEFIDDGRRHHHLAQAEQVSSADGGQPAPDEESLRARREAARDHRFARISSITADQGELLHAKAEEIERTGTAYISTAAGEISASLVRFRWGKDVLDISRTRGGQQAGWSLGTVPRAPAQARTAAITFDLAKALAALEPLPPSG